VSIAGSPQVSGASDRVEGTVHCSNDVRASEAKISPKPKQMKCAFPGVPALTTSGGPTGTSVTRCCSEVLAEPQPVQLNCELMREIILTFCLVASCVAQSVPSTDPKVLYEQAMNKLTGTGANRSDLTGLDLMTRSADLGYPPAQLAAGYLYESGRVVGIAANPSKAAEYYRKAASTGSHLAEYQLGRMYFLGVYGTSRRDGEKWLQSAADAGSPFAAYLLGLSLYDREPAAGLERFKAAAAKGLSYAQYRLGKALIDGRATPVDKHAAYVWFFVAAEAGVGEAATEASLLEGSLGATETENAKVEARELQAKVRRSVTASGCTGWDGELDAIPTVPPLSLQQFCE
jgi:TPR repeat protein